MSDEALAAQIRDRCLKILLVAYEEAGMLGLCHEGRWEYALDQLRHVAPVHLLSPKEGVAGDR